MSEATANARSSQWLFKNTIASIRIIEGYITWKYLAVNPRAELAPIINRLRAKIKLRESAHTPAAPVE
ncbi:hypothetical protein [Thermococcus sp. Bubb.Bath]|uniref:hypothetical protein n=1 Tax=Thermococcus sp. Bubb.Bath TaxID=1638242 RepID=UPI00143B8402|nr:hypothetical protein [Thermococcus sp. Bubb.Bath]NJF25580.1 hypothetical protein [Thermococcus sp. Bubb.Bath]